jgi:hypothetical protein
MAASDARGNDDDKAFTMTRADSGNAIFDRFDCAAVEFAPSVGHHERDFSVTTCRRAT